MDEFIQANKNTHFTDSKTVIIEPLQGHVNDIQYVIIPCDHLSTTITDNETDFRFLLDKASETAAPGWLTLALRKSTRYHLYHLRNFPQCRNDEYRNRPIIRNLKCFIMNSHYDHF